VSHEGIADEHDVVLSPSDCRQKIGEIAIAGDEDYCGWRWIVLDECHDIHCARYEDCSAVSYTVETTRQSSSSLPSSFHCAGSLGWEVSEEVRLAGCGGRTRQGQSAGLKFRPEGRLPRRRFVWELEVCLEDVDRPELAC